MRFRPRPALRRPSERETGLKCRFRSWLITTRVKRALALCPAIRAVTRPLASSPGPEAEEAASAPRVSCARVSGMSGLARPGSISAMFCTAVRPGITAPAVDACSADSLQWSGGTAEWRGGPRSRSVAAATGTKPQAGSLSGQTDLPSRESVRSGCTPPADVARGHAKVFVKSGAEMAGAGNASIIGGFGQRAAVAPDQIGGAFQPQIAQAFKQCHAGFAPAAALERHMAVAEALGENDPGKVSPRGGLAAGLRACPGRTARSSKT